MSSPNPESSGPPLRALAMVLISLAILFAAIGALSLSGSGSDEQAGATTSETEQPPASAAQTPAAPTSSAQTSAAPTSAATSGDPTSVEVRVLNNSDVSGLAATTAATLTAEGWTIAETGNYAESQVPATTVYYGTASGAEAAAEQIAQQLGATVEERPATLSAFGTGVVVMVTQ